jgi:SOS-response transcriptional repressor LexA
MPEGARRSTSAALPASEAPSTIPASSRRPSRTAGVASRRPRGEQRAAILALLRRRAALGLGPMTYAEVARELGLKLRSSVQDAIAGLVSEGLVVTSRTQARSIQLTGANVTSASVLPVEGGDPANDTGQRLVVDRRLVGDAVRSVALRVDRPALCGFGIAMGDWLIVERGINVQPSGIVLAPPQGADGPVIAYLPPSRNQRRIARTASGGRLFVDPDHLAGVVTGMVRSLADWQPEQAPPPPPRASGPSKAPRPLGNRRTRSVRGDSAR